MGERGGKRVDIIRVDMGGFGHEGMGIFILVIGGYWQEFMRGKERGNTFTIWEFQLRELAFGVGGLIEDDDMVIWSISF